MTMTTTETENKPTKKRKIRKDTLKRIMQKAFPGWNVQVGWKPSPQLVAALDALKLDFGKLQQKVDKVFEITRAEKLPDKFTGKLIRKAMKGQYGHDTMTRIFEKYPEAKQLQIHKKVPKIGTFDEGDTKEQEQQEPTDTTDKYRFYKEQVIAKNKVIKQKDEEIQGLREEIARLKKEIARLSKKDE